MIIIRPVGPGDAARLAGIFAGLGPASRLARYLAPKHDLSTAELRSSTDVDHHDHEALIAIVRPHGEAIGIARFIRDPHDPTSAEVALEVVDAWQNRGVGSRLAARLAERAQREDLAHFTATISAGNRRAVRLLARSGAVIDVTRDGAALTYRIALPAPAEPRGAS